MLYNLQSFIASVNTASALSNQYDSELLGEKRSNIVFNWFAITDGFKNGLSNGL